MWKSSRTSKFSLLESRSLTFSPLLFKEEIPLSSHIWSYITFFFGETWKARDLICWHNARYIIGLAPFYGLMWFILLFAYTLPSSARVIQWKGNESMNLLLFLEWLVLLCTYYFMKIFSLFLHFLVVVNESWKIVSMICFG